MGTYPGLACRGGQRHAVQPAAGAARRSAHGRRNRAQRGSGVLRDTVPPEGALSSSKQTPAQEISKTFPGMMRGRLLLCRSSSVGTDLERVGGAHVCEDGLGREGQRVAAVPVTNLRTSKLPLI